MHHVRFAQFENAFLWVQPTAIRSRFIYRLVPFLMCSRAVYFCGFLGQSCVDFFNFCVIKLREQDPVDDFYHEDRAVVSTELKIFKLSTTAKVSSS